jgi:translation initiation factor 5
MSAPMINIRRDVQDPFYRYKMPKLMIKIEGKGNGIKTVIPNMSDIAKSLNRPPSYPAKYFGSELGAQVILNEKDSRYIVNGAHQDEKLQSLLDVFIDKFVLCGACKNPETFMIVKNDKITLDCLACGQQTAVDLVHRLCAYIVKNPPNETNGARPKSQEKDEKQHQSTEEKVEYVFRSDFYQFLQEYSPSQLTHALILGKAKELKIPNNKVVFELFEYVFTKENILEAIPKYAPLFSKFMTSEKCQKYLIGAVEKFVGATHVDMLEKSAFIFKALYDSDLLEEDAILDWASKISHKFVPKERCKTIHYKAKPFIMWLKEADVEDSEEEESEDDE